MPSQPCEGATHRNVLLDLLVGQGYVGAAAGLSGRQGEVVLGAGGSCACQSLVEVSDIPLLLHLQLLSLSMHSTLTHYTPEGRRQQLDVKAVS